jgi:hypothetical protein
MLSAIIFYALSFLALLKKTTKTPTKTNTITPITLFAGQIKIS